MPKNFKRALAAAAALLAGAVSSLVVATSPAMADGVTVAHKCGNPSRVFKTVRAGICANLVKLRNGSSGPYRLAAYTEAFCQSNLSPYTIKNCRGIVAGADLYRRKPGATAWQLVFHSNNYGCGSLWSGNPTCDAQRYGPYSYETDINDCWEFMGHARASIQLPGDDAVISGILMDSQVWATGVPGCNT
ncbi:hypothetical protein [Actinoplanes teichomyceticus]|uniref:Peptidase inhibitor family I36 n=1 Tax=Actinoplanes teichomyceticus TaxID=1867 RepID=A0A561WB75_ACTTI|nr:hypothetical protein [Actinoplanes teichomyceticus]TWG21103.1 hypothetical protein FHX34_103633 [Actinoplanes teichomyceticus]GIF14922.1 hypothetical protein Ate01nite_49540 [Actinoplanes teichomyceticus]